MTKAPFSVEWLSQSSQAPRNPAEGAPRRASSAAAGPRPDSGSSPGLSERSGKEAAGPRAGRGGRSRERTAAPAAAGAGERAWGAGQPPAAAAAAAAEPESPGAEEPGGRGGRRLRTAFSAEQISTLESSFQRHQYLGAAERRKLAGRMQLSEVQIKTWFQNRRMKLKRQLQELRPEPFCSPPLPYGPQSGLVPLPLAYAARPPPLPRQEAAPGGFALAALPAPALDLSSACRAQPPGFWAAPCFVGYRDPRAFLLGV
ncbi:transcription factor LBX2-like [Apteryx mantelli]|uniref:Transcription factor LBX2-like n=1 Tax=Apteryx mantelli TaxID=2696672 RepID=A0ABM4ESG3_9AVES